MPFFLPALIAVVSDICVIWLSSYTPHYDATTTQASGGNNNVAVIDSNENNDHWVYYTIDIYCGSVAALLRLCILCIPLLYHSYTGTAIRYTLWYRTIYIGMALLVAFHIISFLIIQPESIESLLIIHAPATSTDPQYEYRRLWLILLLSSVSLLFHHILLRHVRSTAPTPPMMLRMLNQHRQNNKNMNSLNKNSSYYFLCGNYIQNTVQPTMYFAVRTAAAAAAAATDSVATKRTTTTTILNNNYDALPAPPFNNNLRDSDDENDMGRIEQEPALINAMNGMFIYLEQLCDCSTSRPSHI